MEKVWQIFCSVKFFTKCLYCCYVSICIIADTRKKQLAAWKQLILDYQSSQNSYKMTPATFPCFSNPSINRKCLQKVSQRLLSIWFLWVLFRLMMFNQVDRNSKETLFVVRSCGMGRRNKIVRKNILAFTRSFIGRALWMGRE